MKITKVKYSKLITIPDRYDNITLGAEAIVEDGETPEDARTNLMYWVNEHLKVMGYTQDTIYDLEEEVRRIERHKEGLGNEIERLKEIKEKMVQFLRTHGCDITKINMEWDSEVPF